MLYRIAWVLFLRADTFFRSVLSTPGWGKPMVLG